MADVAINDSTVSIIFGKYATIRSPLLTPQDFIQFEIFATLKFKFAQDKTVLYPFSLLNIIDGSVLFFFNKFAA